MGNRLKVELAVGNQQVVVLGEMAGAGYLWDLESLIEAGVVSVQDYEEEKQERGPDASVGDGIMRRLVLRGEREGTVTSTHSRPWLTAPGPGDEVLEVTVLPREGGMTMHDLWKGREFVLDGLVMTCVDAGWNHVVARELDGPGSLVLDSGLLSRARVGWWEPDMQEVLPRTPIPGSLWRHRKGSLYVIVAEGRLEADAMPSLTYRGVAGGDVWTRSREQFLDGGVDSPRFVRLA